MRYIASLQGICLLFLVAGVSGCAEARTSEIVRIGLLAPFEGENRAIGYEALYAARMAVADADSVFLELLPIDDGGNRAADRAEAMANDPLIKAVLWLGDGTQSTEAQAAFDDLPVIVVGDWGAQADGARIFIMEDEQLPDAVFQERYRDFDAFAPEPGMLAVPVYEAAVKAIAAARTGSRSGASAYLSDLFG